MRSFSPLDIEPGLDYRIYCADFEVWNQRLAIRLAATGSMVADERDALSTQIAAELTRYDDPVFIPWWRSL